MLRKMQEEEKKKTRREERGGKYDKSQGWAWASGASAHLRIYRKNKTYKKNSSLQRTFMLCPTAPN